ncbi:LLM class flavin-dependent oxidoreductase [Streptomyces sp. NPDC059906]|uniref:LLM class flavin-dependent oxidoreductase n=1 Tax=Streptomyces sp. NPDC059906 TaxID=3346997 RepID=UPI003649647A
MLIYGTDPREAADHVTRLEVAGLDTVWVAEGYGYDSPTLMGYLAARTSTVEIGAALLNVYSGTPTILASTAAARPRVRRPCRHRPRRLQPEDRRGVARHALRAADRPYQGNRRHPPCGPSR